MAKKTDKNGKVVSLVDLETRVAILEDWLKHHDSTLNDVRLIVEALRGEVAVPKKKRGSKKAEKEARRETMLAGVPYGKKDLENMSIVALKERKKDLRLLILKSVKEAMKEIEKRLKK